MDDFDDEPIDDKNEIEIDILSDDEEDENEDSEDEGQDQYYRTETKKIPSSKRKTMNKLTKYERVRVLGFRITQLEHEAEPKVEVTEGMTPIEIAEKELKEKVIPIIIKRTLSDGKFELWKINELI